MLSVLVVGAVLVFSTSGLAPLPFSRPMPVGDEPTPAAQFLDQDLDHFNPQDAGSLQQRYFVNDTFWDKSNHGPVFLLIEGESTASPVWAVRGHHMELAQIHKALVIVAEHRFYGYSLPEALGFDLRTRDLQELSSHQALADLAVLIEKLQVKLGFDADVNKIIAFGGSYPGNLAAWSRIKFPHLIHGAIASSAPVRAQLDFPEYMQVVKASMSDEIAGGSQECIDEIAAAFVEVEHIVLSGDEKMKQDLGTKFKSCHDIANTVNDAKSFVGTVAGYFQEAVQYNPRVYPSIADMCNVFTNKTSGKNPLEKLAEAAELPFKDHPVQCHDYSYNFMIQDLNTTMLNKDNPAADRQWTYQTCTQFGYYQTCEEDCIFSKILDLQFYTEMCQDLFDFAAEDVEDRIEFSNDYYGGSRPLGSRIVFVNGDIDPWHTLSVLKDLPNDQTSVFIRGASHCQNMLPSRPTDSIYIKQARDKIAAKVSEWLSPASVS